MFVLLVFGGALASSLYSWRVFSPGNPGWRADAPRARGGRGRSAQLGGDRHRGRGRGGGTGGPPHARARARAPFVCRAVSRHAQVAIREYSFHERQRLSETRKVCDFMFSLSKPVKSLIVRKIWLLWIQVLCAQVPRTRGSLGIHVVRKDTAHTYTFGSSSSRHCVARSYTSGSGTSGHLLQYLRLYFI